MYCREVSQTDNIREVLCQVFNGMFPQAVQPGVCSSCCDLGRRDKQQSWTLKGTASVGPPGLWDT